MERALYGWGALLGLIVSLMLMPSYEAASFVDRAFIACIMLATAMCIGGFFMPLVRDRDGR